MGYDISYHPISKKQLKEWYFDALTDALDGKRDDVEKRAVSCGLDKDDTETYVEIMKVAADTESTESFEKTHAYYAAVIQGLFRKYYYVRGSALSFLIEKHSEVGKYVTSWKEIRPGYIKCQISNRLVENYSGGVYLDEKQVCRLENDLRNDEQIKRLFNEFFGVFMPVFEAAINDAASNNLGLLEASEVVEPNPMDLNNSSCYSNLMNCDPEGALLFQRIAVEQIKAAQRPG